MMGVVISARTPGESPASVQLRAVTAQLNSAIDELREVRDLLRAYAVDQYGAFPLEVDRYLATHPEPVR